MHVIILAAGKSQRFQNAGYTTPKPFLPIEWRGLTEPMVGHVLRSIPVEFSRLTFAVLPEHVSFLKNIRLDAGRGVNVFEIIQTKGPGDTAYQVLDMIPTPQGVLILDSDVINHTNDIGEMTRHRCCSVLVSQSVNPAFSYVDKLGYFTHIKEKEVISKYAVRGAYFIPRTGLIDFRYSLELAVASEEEPYISHGLDNYAKDKLAIETTYEPTDWGTPEAIMNSGAQICT